MNTFRVRDRVLFVLFATWSLIAGSGCPATGGPAPASPQTTAKPQPLMLIVVDDPQLGKAIVGEWRGRTEEELTVRDVTLAEIAAASRLPGDAVIFPSGLIGQFAERGWLTPLEPAALEDSEFNYRDIFDQVRRREMKWGSQTIAVPLGSPQLLLAYRADVFEKLLLMPPVTWSDYQSIVEQLADRKALGDLAPPEDQPWRATTEPLADGWAGQTLLARAAAYAMYRDQVSPMFRLDNLQPLIGQPPYIRALEELAAATHVGGFAELRASPEQVLAEISSGHCAMALTWVAPGIAAKDVKSQGKLAFALLPGGTQAYRFATKTWESRGEAENIHVPLLAISGRMAAVASSSADPRRAQGFVLWLSGRDVSQQVGSHSAATTLFRQSQIATSSRWTGSLASESSRQYADILGSSLDLPRAFPGLTIPGRSDYLAALDKAVSEAVSGQQPAKEALTAAAARWQEITEKLGVDSQRRANAHSLGQGD